MTAAADWTGKVGDTWAREWQRTEQSFVDLEQALARAILSVTPTSGQFLDLGCGVGTTAAGIAAARPDATVTGIDLSPALVATAQARHTAANLRFVAGDALGGSVDQPLDLIFSRHGVMFFADPVAAFTHLRARCSAGAPLVFSCFRARRHNAWAAELGAATGQPIDDDRAYTPGPFAFADRDFVADLLARAGWQGASAATVDFDYVAGTGADDAAALADALAFFTRIGPAAAAIRACSDHARAELLERIGTRLARYARHGRVAMPASAWIWTARA
ncbi:class I SAM-dependent methyltransferase [Sphingomonas sp.]|uniref:class I SAM-dependent methyltransferase n=1 Tax=Sphingomonas sp. TaxID=28214 RepID=UPI0035C862D2